MKWDERATVEGIIISMIKLRRMIWVEHIARVGEMRNAYETVFNIPEWKETLRRLSIT
jgi:hypothetical protein